MRQHQRGGQRGQRQQRNNHRSGRRFHRNNQQRSNKPQRFHSNQREILVSSGYNQVRLAMLDGNNLDEFYEEDEHANQLVGSIYKGKVSSVIPGIGAAFIGIGLERNGFLYVGDVVGEAELSQESSDFEDDAEEPPKPSTQRNRQKRRIEELLKVDQEILVQVVKEPFGTKGARLTCHVSLPGRYVVLMPFNVHRGISKRIEDRKERERIRELIRSMNIPKEIGIIVRTVAAGCTRNALERDIRFLLNTWKLIKRRSQVRNAPSILHEEFGIVLRMIRDVFNDRFQSINIDNREIYRRAERYMKATVPELLRKLKFYKGDQGIFTLKGVEKELERINEAKIQMRSGGSIVIEQTEALVSIDVNTGKFTGSRNLEDTAYRTNCEAAREIAKQIRLRDLGGIIIIDFIDMERGEHRRSVIHILEDSLKKDRAKTSVLNLSELGLVQMTRQRIRKSLETTRTQRCPSCHGRGTIMSNKRIAAKALDKAGQLLRTLKHGTVEITAVPEVVSELLMKQRSMILPVEKACEGKIFVMSDANLPVEETRIKRVFERRRRFW